MSLLLSLLLFVVQAAAVGSAPGSDSPGPIATSPVHRTSITDTRTDPGAFCTYDRADPRRRVYVPVHMPRIYWPDTHPGRTDRGTVGWQIQLQVAPAAAGPWRVAYTSSITKGTATDRSPAAVAKHAINWRVLHRTTAYYRVQDRMTWYSPRGTLVATQTHLVRWYQLAVANAPWHEGSPGGWDIGATLGRRHQSCPNLLAH